MSRRFASRLLLGLGAVGAAVMVALGLTGLPALGHIQHPYGAEAVSAAVARHTANAISSVNFDQRAFDTLGEEFVLFGAAFAAVLLLRRMHEEDQTSQPQETPAGDLWSAVRLMGFVMLAPTLLVGGYVVAHGAVSPGGGFQGGAVLATGLHLSYLAGDYSVLKRLRPLAVFDVAEAVGAAAFVLLGLSAVVAGGPFLANWLPLGGLAQLTSAGTVELFNVAVGMEVASALVLLVAKFLDQALLLEDTAHE